MIPVIATVLIVLLLLLINEWWWRGRTHGEISRKFVHLTVGIFVAFWPLFLTWRQIEFLSLAFVVVVLISQKLRLFKAIHTVQRPTHGELFFALSVGVVAFLTHNPAIYAVALLHMALADGLAAIVGVKFGSSTAYIMFGSRKSIAGTLTFLVVSACLISAYALTQQTDFTVVLIAAVAGATLIENIGAYGLDNLLVPVYVALLLNLVV